MKKFFNVPSVRLFGLIVLAAIIGFSMAACKDDDDDAIVVLTAPTGLTATAYSSTGITLTWNSVPGATGYHVYNGTNPSALGGPGTAESNFAYNYGLPSNTTIYYQVAAINASGEGPRSSVASATTLSSGYSRSSLTGVWEITYVNGGTNLATNMTPGTQAMQITVIGSSGYFTRRDFSPAEQDAINKGYYNLNSVMWRNLTNTGNLTWSGQYLQTFVSGSNNDVVVGTEWANSTITMSADGQTITITSSSSISTLTNTWTRK